MRGRVALSKNHYLSHSGELCKNISHFIFPFVADSLKVLTSVNPCLLFSLQSTHQTSNKFSFNTLPFSTCVNYSSAH